MSKQLQFAPTLHSEKQPYKIEIRRTGTRRPYVRNSQRNHQDVEQMVTSMRESVFKIPLRVRNDVKVVDGHPRLNAALAPQMEELPVILCKEGMPAQVSAFWPATLDGDGRALEVRQERPIANGVEDVRNG